MKKIVMMIVIGIVLILVAITVVLFYQNREWDSSTKNNSDMENETQNRVGYTTNQIKDSNTTNQVDKKEENIEKMRIKLSFEEEEILINLEENQSSRMLLERLPLTLNFEDFNSVEKIAYLPEKLNVEEESSGYDPQKGDFAYYIPWGNVVIYYNDFGYSNSLVKLGTIESGIEKLEKIREDFTVRIERVY